MAFNSEIRYCNEDYLGETGRRINERIANHCEKEKQSQLLKYELISKHLKVIDKNYHENKDRRKISEAL